MGDEATTRVSPHIWRQRHKGMGPRLARALWRAGVGSLADAAAIDSSRWLEQRNFGQTTLHELRELLARHGLHLIDEPREGGPAGTVWTHDLPREVDALLARLRACDGRHADAAVIVWEQCQLLVAEVESLKRDNEALHVMHLSACDRVAQQSELLGRRAEAAPGATPLAFLYRNWRGEESWRRVVPRGVRWAATEWHPEPQWLLDAFDLERQAERSFALRDILRWEGS